MKINKLFLIAISSMALTSIISAIAIENQMRDASSAETGSQFAGAGAPRSMVTSNAVENKIESQVMRPGQGWRGLQHGGWAGKGPVMKKIDPAIQLKLLQVQQARLLKKQQNLEEANVAKRRAKVADQLKQLDAQIAKLQEEMSRPVHGGAMSGAERSGSQVVSVSGVDERALMHHGGAMSNGSQAVRLGNEAETAQVHAL